MELRLKNIKKKYGDTSALDKVNLQLTEGVYGILGQNGAGKTTIMNIIAGVLKPTEGEVLLDNVNIQKMKKSIKVCLDICRNNRECMNILQDIDFCII